MTNPAPLEFGKIYHIYNRGNNRENIFVQERNYAYFLKLWAKYIDPIADTYAYCLLRNHFHSVVLIKESDHAAGTEAATTRLSRDSRQPVLPESHSSRKTKQPSKHFSDLFNAYARAVNLATRRSGALFERPFSRIEVTSEDYLARLIVYIHQNPQKHGFVSDFRDWPHSSFHELADGDSARSKKDWVMDLFGGRETFLQIHKEIQPLDNLEDED